MISLKNDSVSYLLNTLISLIKYSAVPHKEHVLYSGKFISSGKTN